MGFDAISAIGGSNIKNPAKDLPRMIVLSLILMIGIYILFTLAICTITPAAEIDIINGILNCFILTFDGSLGTALYVIIGLIFLYTLVSQGPLAPGIGIYGHRITPKTMSYLKFWKNNQKRDSPRQLCHYRNCRYYAYYYLWSAGLFRRRYRQRPFLDIVLLYQFNFPHSLYFLLLCIY